MWLKIIILIRFSQYFILGEIIINDEEESKQTPNHTIQEITKKIDKISNLLLTQCPFSNKSYILNKLESKLLASENLALITKNHVQSILEGIKLKILNEEKDKQTTTEENSAKEVDQIENNDQNELISEISSYIESLIANEFNSSFNISKNVKSELPHNDISKRKVLPNSSRRKVEHEPNYKKHHNSNTDDINKSSVKMKKFVNHINNLKTFHEQDIPTECNHFINCTCEDVKNINRLKCRSEQTYIALDKLCDGNSDCPFESDEKNCYSQVMERLLYLKQVEDNIESSQYSKCFEFETSRSVLMNQAKTLRNVLENELNSKMKLKYQKYYINKKNNAITKPQQKEVANNIALVISSLALALDGALCSNKLDIFDTSRSNALFDIDLDEEFKKSLSPPQGCKCIKAFCFNCTHYCKRLCRQTYSLTKWNCESINGTDMVSVNLLCDGKFDCVDATDERGCDKGTGYTEANEIYSNIINMLQLKAFKERQPIQKMLYELSDLIMRLQNVTMTPEPNLIIIKKQRDKCYSMLRTVFSDIVKLSDIGKESEEAFLFLLSINQNLGAALQRSHTGNAKIMDNECVCTNGTCTKISFCSKICAKACAIEPKLTRYYCYGKSEESISIEKICDGIEDCSNGYDEFDCKKDEICRDDHIVILRNNLQGVGDNLAGTALGELLISWKLKVISALKVLENTKRHTPQILKNVAEGILKDLVVTYGSVEKYKRSTADYVLRVFIDISQIVLELMIKSCRK